MSIFSRKKYTEELDSERDKLKVFINLQNIDKIISIERINIGTYEEETIIHTNKDLDFSFKISRKQHNDLISLCEKMKLDNNEK